MAKKATNKNNQRIEDAYARVLQMVAILATVVVVIVGQVVDNSTIPIWVPAGLLGVAVGLSPEQIARLVLDIIKTMFTGAGRK